MRGDCSYRFVKAREAHGKKQEGSFTDIYRVSTNRYRLTCNFVSRGIIHFLVSPTVVAAPELPAANIRAAAEPLHERKRYAPIIIIGMHRSGTSLLSHLLESLGLFLGKKKDENHEAIFFQSINEWLLRQVGGAWDNPAPIRYLLENFEIRQRTAEYIQRTLFASPRSLSYLGWAKYVRQRRITSLPQPWGWKDPRNTFTLALWLDIFPEAKIIHLHRSGVDVALSLRRRGRRELRFQHVYRTLPFLHWIRPKRGGFVHSLRCDQLDAGLALWKEYVDQASSHVVALKRNAFEVSFETLVRQPEPTLAALSQFCDLPVDIVRIRRASAQINPAVLAPSGDYQLCDSPLRSS